MTGREILALFDENTDFQEYVNKYCIKHKKCKFDAVQDDMVRGYAEWIINQPKKITK